MTIAHELARKFGKNLPPPNMLVLESGSLNYDPPVSYFSQTILYCLGGSR